MDVLRNMGLVALFSLLLTFTPFVMAVAHVIRPNARWRARTGSTTGFVNVLGGLARRGFTAETYAVSAIGSAEALVPLFVGFGCLTVAWLLIAAGMGRQAD